jgi:phosphate transport system substrate-binding protein
MRTTAVAAALAVVVACGGQHGTMIQNKGSDTLLQVAQAWAERYQQIEPGVVVAVSGGGSGTGLSALINGTADLANSSRPIKAKEIEMAKARGVTPVEFIVGYDALAVYVHPSNPRDRFTLGELAEIYGEGGQSDRWSALGVEVPGCSGGEIVRVSRQNNSGTYVSFKEVVLGEGREYKLGSMDMHGSKEVVDLVAHTPCAIGYSGLAYRSSEVKLATIARTEEGPYVAPAPETASSGSYPISRPLYMYTRGEPTGAVKAYLDWILSEEGQKIIVEKGYAPAPVRVPAGG